MTAYRDNDPALRIEALERELAEERQKGSEERSERMLAAYDTVFRLVGAATWRIGLVVLVYGVFSFFAASDQSVYGGMTLVRPVWIWRTPVAIWTFGVMSFGRQVVRWMKGLK